MSQITGQFEPGMLTAPGPNPPAGAQANPSGVGRLKTAPLGAPSVEEAEVAVFRTIDEAQTAVEAIVAAGVGRECVALLTDRDAKRNFMKTYVHRDNDRASHSGAGMVFFGAGGAGCLGLVFVLAAYQFSQASMVPTIAGLLGGVIGAIIGGVFGGIALRSADDRSMEMVDHMAESGPVVAVVPAACGIGLSLTEVGKILSRHNGLAVRLKQHVSLADLHPGDLRPDQM
jgi:hypothetical protein